jgi:hypothetical protein
MLLLLSRSLAAYRFSSRYDQPIANRPAPVVTTEWWLQLLLVLVATAMRLCTVISPCSPGKSQE